MCFMKRLRIALGYSILKIVYSILKTGYPDAAIPQHLELASINVVPITLAYTRALRSALPRNSLGTCF